MSRSRRHTPIIGVCATPRSSEKQDKQIWHRAYRRAENMACKRRSETMPHRREHSNPWDFSKDGKVWIGDGGWYRSDPKKAMRK